MDFIEAVIFDDDKFNVELDKYSLAIIRDAKNKLFEKGLTADILIIPKPKEDTGHIMIGNTKFYYDKYLHTTNSIGTVDGMDIWLDEKAEHMYICSKADIVVDDDKDWNLANEPLWYSQGGNVEKYVKKCRDLIIQDMQKEIDKNGPAVDAVSMGINWCFERSKEYVKERFGDLE